MSENNKETGLAAALAKIEGLNKSLAIMTADNQRISGELAQSQKDLQATKDSLANAEVENKSLKEQLESEQGKQRNIDNEVAAKAATIAAESGIATPISDVPAEADMSDADILAEYNRADIVGKAAILDKYKTRILSKK